MVKINKFKIINFDTKKQKLKILINVFKGFYVRSFCEDLAKKLKTITCVTKLKRIKSGKYLLKNTYELNEYLKLKNLKSLT